jgi:hypothetical protein
MVTLISEIVLDVLLFPLESMAHGQLVSDRSEACQFLYHLFSSIVTGFLTHLIERGCLLSLFSRIAMFVYYQRDKPTTSAAPLITY